MCFGGSSSSTPLPDPQIKEQQEADMQKAEETKTEQKEQQVQSSVAVNKPLVQTSSINTTPPKPVESDANPLSGEYVSDVIKQNTINKRAEGTVLRRRKKTGRSSLFTGQGGGIGYYSKYRA